MDIEQTMQFILDAQARLQATASQHDERLAKLETSLAGLATSLAGLESSVGTLTDLVGRLAQAEIRLVERMDRLAESQAHTDQRLDILIDVVDKLVHRNGSPR
jgi:uncharacterized coiled-coil protein SlyX